MDQLTLEEENKYLRNLVAELEDKITNLKMELDKMYNEEEIQSVNKAHGGIQEN